MFRSYDTCLVVAVVLPVGGAFVLSAHAPHKHVGQEVLEQWWSLTQQVPEYSCTFQSPLLLAVYPMPELER